MPPIIPLDKVQGIILRGYELLEEATFVLLQIADAVAARQWLADLVARRQITDATEKPADTTNNPKAALVAVNVAFTWPGLLRLLQQDPKQLHGFSREFQEGMVTSPRQRILGDAGPSAPEHWAWGSCETNTPHVLLMLYALDKPTLQALLVDQEAAWNKAGMVQLLALPTEELLGRKEQFGFRDGIAQPFIEGVRKTPPLTEKEPPVEGNILKAGELLLGYANEYEKSPVRPLVPASGTGAYLDFGSNGSYLVFRQLRQDVRAFWKFLYEATAGVSLSAQTFDVGYVQRAVQLAAKMVGPLAQRAPLILASDEDDPRELNEDHYGYSQVDPLGIKCPIGSHTRRSNPRDSLEPGPGVGRLTSEESLRVTRRHRIVRRGRPYGPPLDPSMEPEKMVRAIAAAPERSDAVDRGLHFLCFNADIARQFEFIQQTWINNPKFGGLYADNDPIMGQRFLPQVSPTFKVTAPALAALSQEGLPDPVREKLIPLLDREAPNQDAFLMMLPVAHRLGTHAVGGHAGAPDTCFRFGHLHLAGRSCPAPLHETAGFCAGPRRRLFLHAGPGCPSFSRRSVGGSPDRSPGRLPVIDQDREPFWREP